MSRIECPKCNGTGKILGEMDGFDWFVTVASAGLLYVLVYQKRLDERTRCKLCDGRGIVSVKEAEHD